MPQVSVVTRTKNRPLLLERAAASVVGQRFGHQEPGALEWIVVNDGGDPAPVERIVEAARAERPGLAAVTIHNPESLGMEGASRRGIATSSAPYLVIHDDDDTWDPDFLAATSAFLDTRPHYGGVISHTLRVDERIERGDEKGDTVRRLGEKPYNEGLLAVGIVEIARVNLIPPISFLFRRDVHDRIGGFDASLPVLGDWDFTLRFLIAADIGVVPRPLAYYHFRPKGAGLYGNTVVDGIDRHIEYDAILRNRMLRADLETGRFGPGMMIALARQHGELRRDLNPLLRVSRMMLTLRRLVGRLTPGPA